MIKMVPQKPVLRNAILQVNITAPYQESLQITFTSRRGENVHLIEYNINLSQQTAYGFLLYRRCIECDCYGLMLDKGSNR